MTKRNAHCVFVTRIKKTNLKYFIFMFDILSFRMHNHIPTYQKKNKIIIQQQKCTLK